MTMRVTEMTKRDHVVGQLQKNSKRLQDLQSEMATGRKINKTSDDPIGATILQDIVTGISQNEQLSRNIDSNISWLERNEVELGHIAELLTSAKTLLLSQAGDSGSGESRAIVARELRATQKALFDAANARSGKLYLFSGKKTLTPPLQVNSPIQKAKIVTEGIEQKDVADLLDVTQFKAQFEGFSSNRYHMRITQEGTFGRAKYQISDDDGKTWGEERVLLPTLEVANESGRPDDKVLLRFTDDQGLLGDLLPDVTGATGVFSVADKGIVFPKGLEMVYLPNPPIAYVGSKERKEVLVTTGITVPIQITAEELFLKTGDDSINIFEVFSAIEKALEQNDSKALSQRIENLDQALNQVLKRQADVGNINKELKAAKQKLDDQIFSRQSRFAEIQDIDVAEASVSLSAAERDNKLSLDVGGRLLQPSLMDFLK